MRGILTVCIVDPSLTGTAGHPFNYTRAIVAELDARGIPHVVITSRALSVELGVELSARRILAPTLSGTLGSASGPARLAVVAAGWWRLQRTLAAELNGSVSGDWIVFAPNVGHRQLLGWAATLRRWPRGRRPRTVLMLRFSVHPPWWPNAGMKSRIRNLVLRLSLRALGRAGERRGLALVSDSERLTREYTVRTGLPVHLMPIPHTGDVPVSTREANPATCFAYLGEARDEKGFDILVEALLILTSRPSGAHMRFVVQACPSSVGADRSVAALDRLRAASPPQVALLEGALDRARYNEVLAGTDVVVLPYRLHEYAARTSGPFAEALAAAKPVIVTSGTWMSDMLVHHGAGLNSVDGDPHALADCMIEADQMLALLATRARGAAARWASEHNPAAFVDRLLEVAHL